MDELQISGKRFISSRRIARENGYTSDYIGQLIRGGKITGQKVGRAWYVDASSFDKYLGAEGAPIRATEAPEVEEVEVAAVSVAAPIAVTAEVEAPEVAVEEEVSAEPEGEVAAAEEIPEVSVETPEIKEEAKVLVVEQAVEEESTEKFEEAVEEPVNIKIIKIPEPVIARMQPEAAHHIPLRIFRKEEKTAPKESSGGLRYYTDDAPVLSEISSSKKESRVSVPVTAYATVSEGGAVPQKAKRMRPVLIGGLALASFAIFVFFAFVSSALSLNLSSSEGNTASVSYGLQW